LERSGEVIKKTALPSFFIEVFKFTVFILQ
jgi:hypothetical protein